MSAYTDQMTEILNEIIDITQTAQWQFFPAACTCEAAQETMNEIYELAHRALAKLAPE